MLRTALALTTALYLMPVAHAGAVTPVFTASFGPSGTPACTQANAPQTLATGPAPGWTVNTSAYGYGPLQETWLNLPGETQCLLPLIISATPKFTFYTLTADYGANAPKIHGQLDLTLVDNADGSKLAEPTPSVYINSPDGRTTGFAISFPDNQTSTPCHINLTYFAATSAPSMMCPAGAFPYGVSTTVHFEWKFPTNNSASARMCFPPTPCPAFVTNPEIIKPGSGAPIDPQMQTVTFTGKSAPGIFGATAGIVLKSVTLWNLDGQDGPAN